MAADSEPTALMWIVIVTCTALVMMMQVGFCCLESGLVRFRNSVNMAIKNLIDFSLAASIFSLFGYGIMFGVTRSGWFGASDFLFGQDASPSDLAFLAPLPKAHRV